MVPLEQVIQNEGLVLVPCLDGPLTQVMHGGVESYPTVFLEFLDSSSDSLRYV